MSVTLITEPKRTINTVLSSSSADLSQELFIFERKDEPITAITQPATNFVLAMASTVRFVVGDSIFVFYDSTAGADKVANTTVLVVNTNVSIEVPSADLVTPVTPQTGSYANNLSIGWRLQITVLNLAGVDNLFGDVTFSYTSTDAGVIQFSIHRILAGLLLTRAEASPEPGGQSGKAIGHVVEFIETGTNVPTPTPVKSSDLTGVLAQKQAQTEGGANMFRQLLDLGLRDQILTDFTQPRAYIVWATTVAYLIDDLYTVRVSGVTDPFVRFDARDTNLDDLPALPPVDSPTRARDTVSIVDEPILNKTLGNDQRFVRATVMSTGVNVVSNSIDFEIFDPTDCIAPIMISWLNSLGGFSQWLFEFDTVINWQEDPGEVVNPPVFDDLEFEGGRTSPLTLRQDVKLTQIITMTSDNLTLNQVQALEFMKHTQFVEVYLNKQATKRIRVRVQSAFSTTTTARQGEHSFTVVIAFPSDFDFLRAINGVYEFNAP